MFYVDKNIINNSVLACFLLTTFIAEFEKNTLNNRNTDIALLLLVLPLLWHETSRIAIRNKKKNTLLSTIIVDNPLIQYSIKDRITNFSGATLQGLNLAVASGLLEKLEIDHNIYFKCTKKKIPKDIKNELPDDMQKCIPRIAFWFSQLDTAEIFSLILGEK
ncbi:three component ABC system middle component [Dickeya parazeae]|uniref:Uncharacterized protein n=1 Tax=Dickeya zeae (strain Ech586) TaxID=590409 RepID=D2BSW8_DICZ5|nr:three component ABC system middle component [Dickeya parazeae]ACZ77731.1 conserved hypothetical protein [Dickeya parazeae Ech586]